MKHGISNEKKNQYINWNEIVLFDSYSKREYNLIKWGISLTPKDI